jgi:pyridoxal phosphate enzyme (YggS family)
MPSSVASIAVAAALDILKERLARAAKRANRAPENVEIVAITKTVDPERVLEAWTLGLTQFGESRVQETDKKRVALEGRFTSGPTPRWHLVGHLQSNKAKRAVELFDCIQSLDSLKLAETLDREGERRAQPVSCLVEIKISEEAAKQGIPPDTLPAFLDRVLRFPFLRIEGVMGVAPFFEEVEKARPSFAALRTLFERNKSAFLVPQPILSMGMSHDFEVAVEEGSTMIRVGSALFGSRG